MITVSTWPPYSCENQYIALYQRALAGYGIGVGPPAVIQDDFLRRNAGQVDAVHIQWTPEYIWRCRGSSAWARARGLVGFWRYLRIARAVGVRLVWTLHDVEHHEGSGRLDEIGYRVLARWADLCIVHDKYAAEHFVKRFGGRSDRVCVMEHGNYDGTFPPARPRAETLARLGVDPACRVLLCQGNVRPYKRYDLAIQAAGRLGAGYHLVVAGRPPDSAFGDDLRRHAAGLKNVTLILESQSEQAISDLFAAADAFLLPYAKITGSGSLLTTATLGRGFIASDLPYFRQALDQEPEAGLCFPVGSVDGLVEAVRRFFTSPAEPRHRAARRIADRVPWSEVVRPVAAWYQKTFPDRLPALPSAIGQPGGVTSSLPV